MDKVAVRSARVLWFLGIIVAFSGGAAQGQQAPINCKGRLSEEQLSGLLKGGVADLRVQAFVNKCGIAFPLTPDAERRLRVAGASDAVVAAVRAHATKLAEPPDEVAREATKREKERLGNQRKAEELRDRIRQAIEAGQLQETEAGLKVLAALLPEDNEMRSWKNWASNERVRRDSMTLVEARKEIASLEKKVEEVRKTGYKVEREGIERRSAKEMDGQSQRYRRRMEELKARPYLEEGAKVEFVSYDADGSRLTANVNGEEYWFWIGPEAARSLVAGLSRAKIERYLREEQAHERVLYDAAARQRFKGVSRAGAEEQLGRESWMDSKTKLMWARNDNGWEVNWNEAMSYCHELRLGGLYDWRLPEIGELEGIYDGSVTQGDNMKGGIRVSNYWAWSATRQGLDSAWSFNFLYGRQFSFTLGSTGTKRALCVRRGGE